MTQVLLEKIERIEALLLEINAKIDNFIGFEDLNNEERDEVEKLREEVRLGEYLAFDDVFGD